MDRLPYDVIYQIIEELCKLSLSDSSDAESIQAPLSFFNTKWVSTASLDLVQQLPQLRLVCRAFAHPAMVHMTRHIPLTFDKPERWLRMVDYWNDENNRDMMDRIEMLSITFDTWEFVEYCKDMSDKENQEKQDKEEQTRLQHDLYTLRTRSGTAYRRQQSKNPSGNPINTTKPRLCAAIRHLTDNLVISNSSGTTTTTLPLPRLKQLHLDVTRMPLWPKYTTRHSKRNPNFKLDRYAGKRGFDEGLLHGLEEAFQLGFNGQLTTLHITARENELVLLLCKTFEAGQNNKLCANLEEFSGRYVPNVDWVKRLPLLVKTEVQVKEGSETQVEREVEVKSGDQAIEMFVARCPKLKRLEVWRPRERYLRLHPLAENRGLDVLSVAGTYMIRGPISIETVLERLATEKTEIQLRDVTAIVRPPDGLVRRPLRPDDSQNWCLALQEKTGCRSVKVFQGQDMVIEVFKAGDRVIVRSKCQNLDARSSIA